MTAPARREPPVSPLAMWLSLISLCLGTAALGAVFTLMMWRGQQVAERRDARQDAAMCELTRALTSGPSPAPGPPGDRARALLPLMEAVRKSACREG